MQSIDASPERLLRDLRVSVLFCTRLPLAHATPVDGWDLARATWALPIAGAAIGALAGAVYWAMQQIGVPSMPAAALALGVSIAITGCLHEDGLADTADGLGGGKDREHKLAIMRDSRVGTYGACALLGSTLLRWSALAAIAFAGAGSVAMALVAAHAGARAPLPAFMRLVPAARRDGLSADAGMPSWESAAVACGLGAMALVLCLGFLAALAGVLLLTLAGIAMARVSVRQIGGQTGDVVGALEQVNEVLILLIAAVALRP